MATVVENDYYKELSLAIKGLTLVASGRWEGTLDTLDAVLNQFRDRNKKNEFGLYSWLFDIGALRPFSPKPDHHEYMRPIVTAWIKEQEKVDYPDRPYGKVFATRIAKGWRVELWQDGMSSDPAATEGYMQRLFQALVEDGLQPVDTPVSEPVPMAEDSLRYAALGFTHHVVPPSAWTREADGSRRETDREWVRTRDREAFEMMTERTRSAIAANQRFFYAFNPQLSHGPWPGLHDGSTTESTCDAGFALYREVDAMLGRYVELLREAGRLDRTLIVALGDHGLRTRTEYPPFHGGNLDDVTFHVPFLLHAPGVLSSPDTIRWMTSHVDIAPSVLDLLGIARDRELELGSPMWEPRVAGRATYFFAKGYLGADGLQRDHQAVMVRYLFGGVSRSPWTGTLRFHARDRLARLDSAGERVIEELNTVAAIQARLTRSMLPGYYPMVPARVIPDSAAVSSASHARRR